MQGSDRVRRLRSRASAKPLAKELTKPRVVGYLRVSTEGQFSDGHGLDVQERAVKAFALSQGYQLVDVVTDCVSGATAPAEREGFRRVMELAGEGAFSILLLYKFDRLARNVLHAVTSVHEMRDRHGIVIRSVTEPIDTATPMGEMIFTVLASMAAQERQVITERTFGGRREKATKGGFAGGAAPFGYQRDKDGGLVVVEAEAAIVRRIFSERADGRTLQTIADSLNADGLRSKRGGLWQVSSVAYIADNPKYRGVVEYLFTWNGADTHVLREGQHTPIVLP
ncbi:recombinase family protein [Methylobacterium komagatae]|uniref:Recombinase family protein n=1 Tax=Methylobacterium komagatae TaxID=374425 RepID=A0ABW2BJJ2_9HYPH